MSEPVAAGQLYLRKKGNDWLLRITEVHDGKCEYAECLGERAAGGKYCTYGGETP